MNDHPLDSELLDYVEDEGGPTGNEETLNEHLRKRMDDEYNQWLRDEDRTGVAGMYW